MDVRGSLRALVYGPPVIKAWGAEFVSRQLMADDVGSIAAFLGRVAGTTTGQAWRKPTVSEALGVPAIQRAVALISSTTGMLSVQAYRNGAVMDDAPRLITRPDPFHTPTEFYGTTAANHAKYGEFVWWIATRDSDGLASALINVPLNELRVEDNPDNRLFPRYTWGTKKGTRYSAANPTGVFVHVMYPLGDPFDLRGTGPLQWTGAATSVSVEANQWAANFYGSGGGHSVLIKHAGTLSPTPDEDGLNEAQRLKAQWVNTPNNVPKVVDQMIEDVKYDSPNPQGAQMLEARQYQNGDAARTFGIPGSLLDYNTPGSSLTYQNLESEFTKFVRTCLQPLYLEPIEQAMSDLLPRAVTARFNVKGFLRADIKTRFEVHEIAIANGIYSPDFAAQEEGIQSGDVEYAPVPFSPPAAIPTALPQRRAASLREVRCTNCQRLLGRAEGRAELACRHCKTVTAA